MGLRERKKLATRRSLQRQAVRLVLERGLEGVTVDDIAEAAGVSTRTFFNYFGSKDEALVGDGPPRPSCEGRAVFIAGGPTGDPFDDLRAYLNSFLDAQPESTSSLIADMRMRKRLVAKEPSLAPLVMARFAASEREITVDIATRMGDSPDALRPQLGAHMATMLMRFTMQRFEPDPVEAGEEPTSTERAALEALFTETFDAFKVLFARPPGETVPGAD